MSYQINIYIIINMQREQFWTHKPIINVIHTNKGGEKPEHDGQTFWYYQAYIFFTSNEINQG